MRNNRREAVRNQRVVGISIVLIIVLAIVISIFSNTIRAQAAPAENSYKYYTSVQVQKGDTLWSIANSYMTDEYTDITEYINEICTINHIDESDIHYGDYLTIPYYSSDYLE